MSLRGAHRTTFVVGLAVFIAVALTLHFVAGLPTWAAIVIPSLILGGLSGLAERGT